MKKHIAGAVAVATAWTLGCSDPTAEERLSEANQNVEAIESEVAAAQQGVEHEEGDLATAEEELEAARQTLREAERRLTEAQSELAQQADDAYLFRAVQTALLTDPELEELAIAARVRDRVVTLEGKVPSAALRKRAEQLASGTLGVAKVENRVSVDVAAPPE